jgi:AcrR family transcriptional regulator
LPPSDTIAVERGLRADAARNLARILDAARAVFAERGSDASMAEIAARAGVGTATIYRRFPTKDDLLAAMFEQGVARLAADAAEAAEAKGVRRALRGFMQRAAAAHMADRGYCDCAETNLKLRPAVQQRFDELIANVDRLLARAKEAGEVRSDVNAYDVPVLLMGVAQAGCLLEERVPGAWKRYLDIVLDGLRPEAARPLSRRPLAARDLRPPVA